jgi:hypothetical protein
MYGFGSKSVPSKKPKKVKKVPTAEAILVNSVGPLRPCQQAHRARAGLFVAESQSHNNNNNNMT